MAFILDQNLCIGCGTCVSMCPKIFKLNENGKAEIINQDSQEIECVKDAAASCPVQAISIKEE